MRNTKHDYFKYPIGVMVENVDDIKCDECGYPRRFVMYLGSRFTPNGNVERVLMTCLGINMIKPKCLDCGKSTYKLYIRKRFNGKRKITNVNLQWCDECLKVV